MRHKQIRRDFIKYASQNILGMAGLSCYILADTFFVARGMGADGLAALNLAIPFFSFIQGVGMMLGMGGATKYAILQGREEKEAARAAFARALLLAVLAGLAFAVPGLLFPRELSAVLGGEGAVGDMAASYLRVIMAFAPAFMLNDVVLCFVRNDGSPRRAMTAMLGGSFANIVLDYVFIFPCGMGIFGAALATGSAPVISLAILLPHFRRSPLRPHWIRPGLAPSWELAALGTPSLIGEVSSGVVMVLYNLIILKLAGNIGVAAYGVVANLYLVVTALFTGLGQGLQPVVSRACGQDRRGDAKSVYRYALAAALVMTAVVYALTLLAADPVAALFNREGDPQLQQIAVHGLRLYFAAFLFSGVNVVSAVFFTSVDRPGPGFLVSILRGLVLIVPTALVMAWLWGMDGVWLSAPAAEALTLCVTVRLVRRP